MTTVTVCKDRIDVFDEVDQTSLTDSIPAKDIVTVEWLFAQIREAHRNQPTSSARATYDPQYGFPKEISIDADRNMIDDEYHVSVTAFEPLDCATCAGVPLPNGSLARRLRGES